MYSFLFAFHMVNKDKYNIVG